jgi:hypothetical protein
MKVNLILFIYESHIKDNAGLLFLLGTLQKGLGVVAISSNSTITHPQVILNIPPIHAEFNTVNNYFETVLNWKYFFLGRTGIYG